MNTMLVPVSFPEHGLSVIEENSGGLDAIREAETYWIDSPRDEPNWAVPSTEKIYVISSSAIDEYRLLSGAAWRASVTPLPSGCVCRPAATEKGLCFIDLEARFCRLGVDDSDPSAPRIRQAAKIPYPFNGYPFDMEGTGSGFVLVFGEGIVELDAAGTMTHHWPFKGFLSGFSFEATTGIGFARDHNRRIYAFRCGSGFSPTPARSKDLPQPFTYSRDACAHRGDGRYAVWLMKNTRTIACAAVAIEADSPSVESVRMVKFEERIVSVARGMDRLGVLISGERFWTADLATEPPEGIATEPTGMIESVIALPVRAGAAIVSRFQRIALAGMDPDPSEPCLREARLTLLGDGELCVDTIERSCSIERNGGLMTQLPSIARGCGARLLAVGSDLLAFALGTSLILTDRFYQVLKAFPGEAPTAAAVHGFVVAWTSEDGWLRLADPRQPRAHARRLKPDRAATALFLRGAALWVGREAGVDRYALRYSGPQLTIERAEIRPIPITPKAIAVEARSGTVAAISVNRAVVMPTSPQECVSYSGDEAFSDLAFDGSETLLLAAASGIVKLRLRGTELTAIARLYVWEGSTTSVDIEAGVFGGNVSRLRWVKALRRPVSGTLIEGSEYLVTSSEAAGLSAMRLGDVRI